jgi:hypothetical protein
MALVATLFACGGEPEAEPTPQEAVSGGSENPHGTIPPVGETVIELPDAVKGKWSAVVIEIEDRTLGTNVDYTVKLGETLEIPDSDLKVEVLDFFPAFLMQGSNITSASNSPENPAAHIQVYEGGAEVFKGWLFANFPTTHPFPHKRFGIVLKEGVAS